MSISKRDCLGAVKHLLDNAESLDKSGELLANNGSYGHAISLLIQASEERMKAIILFLDGNGFQFRKKVKGINSLFVNHNLRYALAMVLSILSIAVDDLRSFLQRAREAPEDSLKLFKDKVKFEIALRQYLIKTFEFLYTEVIWFSNAEYLRQEGFYVDFNDELTSPLSAEKKEYEQVKMRLDRLRYTVESLMGVLREENLVTSKQVEKLKEQFLVEGWYGHVGKVIESFKDRKVNPLEILSNQMEEFSKEIKAGGDIID